MEHWSCVTVIRVYSIYSRHGPRLPVMTFVSKADPRYCNLSPAFGFLANFFSFLLSVSSTLSWGSQRQARIQWFVCFWLPAHYQRQLKCFSPALSLLPKCLACHHIPVTVHGNQNSCQSPKPLIPATYLRLAISQPHWVLSCIFLPQTSCSLMFSDNTPALLWRENIQTHLRYL